MDANEKIKYYENKIEDITTHIEMLTLTKNDVPGFTKVTSTISAVGLPVGIVALNALTDMSASKIAALAITAGGSLAAGIVATRINLKDENKEIDLQISDNLRLINDYENKISLIKKQGR